MDCIDLHIEMLILLNWKFIRKCRCCSHLLKWVVKTLHKKWDDIRFIDLDEAFSLALTYKEFVKKNPVLKHFKQNRHR